MQVIHKPKPQPELMKLKELFAYIHELETENARLEEGYQKSLGVIAATDCEECKNKVYRKAYNDVMKIRANIQEIIEDVRKKDGESK
jgi:tryptophanyl-tRNA synthetase